MSYSGGPAIAYVRINDPQAAETPLFGDGIYVNAWPHSTDPAPPDLVNGSQSNSDLMARYCINRHPNKTINIVYLDGHGESCNLPELWTLHWSNGFQPLVGIVLPSK